MDAQQIECCDLLSMTGALQQRKDLRDERACKQFEYFPSQMLDLGLLANHLGCRASSGPESL